MACTSPDGAFPTSWGTNTLESFARRPGGFDGSLLLGSVECYDPATDCWSEVTAMRSARAGVGVAALAGRLYAVCGHDGTGYLRSVEVYDPRSDWSVTAFRPGFQFKGSGVHFQKGHFQRGVPCSMIKKALTTVISTFYQHFYD